MYDNSLIIDVIYTLNLNNGFHFSFINFRMSILSRFVGVLFYLVPKFCRKEKKLGV
ncbi:hypothetical protein AN1V17_43210 [Vallitalea sediminicola]